MLSQKQEEKQNRKRTRINQDKQKRKRNNKLKILLKQLQCMPSEQQQAEVERLGGFEKLYIEARLKVLPSFGCESSRLFKRVVPREMFKSKRKINLIASAYEQNKTFVTTSDTIIGFCKGKVFKTILESNIISFFVLKNGMLIVATSYYLYVLYQKELQIVSSTPMANVYLMSLSCDETQFVAFSNTTMIIVRMEDGTLHVVNTHELPHPHVTSCLWSQDGTHFIIGCGDGTIITCPVSMQDIVETKFHTDIVTLKRLSPETIISGGQDSILGVWNFENGRLVRQASFLTTNSIFKLCIHNEYIIVTWFRKITVFSYCNGILRLVDYITCNITQHDLIIDCCAYDDHLMIASWFGIVMRYKLKAIEQISMIGCMSLFPVE